jgi:hypothetical protein
MHGRTDMCLSIDQRRPAPTRCIDRSDVHDEVFGVDRLVADVLSETIVGMSFDMLS